MGYLLALKVLSEKPWLNATLPRRSLARSPDKPDAPGGPGCVWVNRVGSCERVGRARRADRLFLMAQALGHKCRRCSVGKFGVGCAMHGVLLGKKGACDIADGEFPQSEHGKEPRSKGDCESGVWAGALAKEPPGSCWLRSAWRPQPTQGHQETRQAAAMTARLISLLLLALSTSAAPKFRSPIIALQQFERQQFGAD